MKMRLVKILTALIIAAPCFAGALHIARVTEYGAKPPLINPEVKSFHKTFKPFKGIAEDYGKNVFLYKYLEKEIGEIVPHYQGPAADGSPGEGDCVGQASAMGCDILAAVNIHMLGRQEAFIGKASVEMLYAGGRVEIGGGQIGNRGGSFGDWQCEFLKQYGVLHRIKYSDLEGNHINLAGYHPSRSRKYRQAGVPDWLERFAKEHPVKEYSVVTSAEEAVDAIVAGQPILVCSSYAFHDTRDEQGFARMKKGRFREQWWHAMLATGVILEGGRQGVIIQNSHGAWNTGPRPYGMPEGSFAVDMADFDIMVKDWLTCYALSAYHGHEARKIRHKLYW